MRRTFPTQEAALSLNNRAHTSQHKISETGALVRFVCGDQHRLTPRGMACGEEKHAAQGTDVIASPSFLEMMPVMALGRPLGGLGVACGWRQERAAFLSLSISAPSCL